VGVVPTSAPFVSIVIPAYRARFFAQALDGACAQSYPNLEIIVCDDAPGSEIGDIVRRRADRRVRYRRNARNLGFAGNFTHGFRAARGQFIKFLNDDDLLHPECVARMIGAFLNFGARAALCTSRRTPIDADGNVLGDIAATRPLATEDSLFEGRGFGDRILAQSLNRIGEPTTVMFRKADVEVVNDNLFRLGETDYHCLADLSLWLRLLLRGDCIYLADPLSQFRLHADQEQRDPRVAYRCLTEHVRLIEDAIALGYLADVKLRRRAVQITRLLLDFSLSHQREHFAGMLDQLEAARARLCERFAADLPP
jgi:glycosyltransferase involved in cell wall biosynthesis